MFLVIKPRTEKRKEGVFYHSLEKIDLLQKTTEKAEGSGFENC